MEGRSFSISSYRFGFGGQEKDDEIAGPGNSYYAQYWQYDPRIGRRWNTDPITYPWQSTYSTFNNNPLFFVDPLGLFGSKKEAKEYKKEHNLKGKIKQDKVSGLYEIIDRKDKSVYVRDPELIELKNQGGTIEGLQDDGVFHTSATFAYQTDEEADAAQKRGGIAPSEIAPPPMLFNHQAFFGNNTGIQPGTTGPRSTDAFNGISEINLGTGLGGSFNRNAENIINSRTTYNQNLSGRDITVRTPVGNVNTTGDALIFVKNASKILDGLNKLTTFYQVGSDFYHNNNRRAIARIAVAVIQDAVVAVPVVGIGLSIGIGVAEYAYGDEFYTWIEEW